MPIRFEHALDIVRPPDRVFAVLDDVSLTPQFVPSCRGIEKITPGPNQVGSRFRYAFQEGIYSGILDGEITEYVPGRRLSLIYQDDRIDLSLDFRMSPTGMGTWLIHTIDVTPKTFMVKMLSSLIESRLPTQTIETLNKLRGLVEAD